MTPRQKPQVTSSGFLSHFPMRAIIIVNERHNSWHLLLRNFVHSPVTFTGPVGQKTNLHGVEFLNYGTSKHCDCTNVIRHLQLIICLQQWNWILAFTGLNMIVRWKMADNAEHWLLSTGNIKHQPALRKMLQLWWRRSGKVVGHQQ
jgi:hypothetical protein